MKAAASCTCLAVIASAGAIAVDSGEAAAPPGALPPCPAGRGVFGSTGDLGSAPGRPMATGVAAPSVVAGAMAAMCAAYRM